MGDGDAVLLPPARVQRAAATGGDGPEVRRMMDAVATEWLERFDQVGLAANSAQEKNAKTAGIEGGAGL